jgi:hypothetical protein
MQINTTLSPKDQKALGVSLVTVSEIHRGRNRGSSPVPDLKSSPGFSTAHDSRPSSGSVASLKSAWVSWGPPEDPGQFIDPRILLNSPEKSDHGHTPYEPHDFSHRSPDDYCRFERSGRFEIAAETMGCRGLKQGIGGKGAAAFRYCGVNCYRFGGGTALHGEVRVLTVIEDDLVGEELDRAKRRPTCSSSCAARFAPRALSPRG